MTGYSFVRVEPKVSICHLLTRLEVALPILLRWLAAVDYPLPCLCLLCKSRGLNAIGFKGLELGRGHNMQHIMFHVKAFGFNMSIIRSIQKYSHCSSMNYVGNGGTSC